MDRMDGAASGKKRTMSAGGEKKNCRCAAGEMGKTQVNLVLVVTFGQETGPLTFIHSPVVACLLIPFDLRKLDDWLHHSAFRRFSLRRNRQYKSLRSSSSSWEDESSPAK